GFVSFEFDGFEDGNLKLKLIHNNQDKATGQKSDPLEMILKKLSVDISKKPIIEKMMDFNIPLTKENIEMVTMLVDYRDKASENPKLIDSFIEKYLEIKGGNTEGSKQNTKSELIKFFNNFGKMTDKDIMLFLEGNIDFNSDNINSYKNVFKGGESIYSSIRDIASKISNESNINGENNINTKVLDVKLGEVEKFFNEIKGISVDKTLLSNKESDVVSEKGIINNSEKNLEQIDKNDIQKIQIDKTNSQVSENGKSNAEVGQKEKNINISSNTSSSVEVSENIQKLDILVKENKVLNILKDNIDSVLGLKDDILVENKTKDVLKELIEFVKVDKVSGKENFNKDILSAVEKLVGKFEKLDSSHLEIIKNIISKASSEIEKLIQDNHKNIDVSLSDIEKDGSKLELSSKLKDINVIDTLLKDFKNVKVELADKQEVMKDILKDLSDKLMKNDASSNIIMSVLKDKISDFKLFNDFNNNYYYLDVPLSLNDEYHCKLIVKDDREDKGGLDSSRLKLVVSVATVRHGTIDGMIEIANKNLKLELKCDKKSMKLLEENKENLNKSLEILGFMPYIFVSEKIESIDSNISDYREFFSDGVTVGLDRKV
ncbi:hypothetical protein, partial [uncultured Clostridium sp.]|uniref:hypothetical protein n=1 Tax=uncultured Clostridium sp. TaxID=59620 RepID=UPI0026397749